MASIAFVVSLAFVYAVAGAMVAKAVSVTGDLDRSNAIACVALWPMVLLALLIAKALGAKR